MFQIPTQSLYKYIHPYTLISPDDVFAAPLLCFGWVGVGSRQIGWVGALDADQFKNWVMEQKSIEISDRNSVLEKDRISGGPSNFNPIGQKTVVDIPWAAVVQGRQGNYWKEVKLDINSNLQLISKMEKYGSKKSLFTSPFLEKTFNLLQNPALEHIISWNHDGTMILINSIEGLSNILPKIFKHKKIESFIRQLNIYDFKKVKKHIAFNAFKHPYFLRNDLSKLHLIKRRVKSGKSPQPSCCPRSQNKQNIETTESVSQKTFEFEQNQERSFEPIEIERAGSLQRSEVEDGFDYLCHEMTLPISQGYYDWEDVFA